MSDVRVPARRDTPAAKEPGSVPAALELERVSVTVRDAVAGHRQRILRELDLTVEPGEHWAVLGPNGAGKTTLLGVAAGAITPASGNVTVLGKPHGTQGLDAPALRVGVLDAVPRVFSQRLTAFEVVRLRPCGPVALMGERPDAADAARAHELLRMFGCTGLIDRRFRDCSQGERRRVMLARALMRDPSLLLLDEPAGGLDLPGRELLLSALSLLADSRPELATVMIAHHVEELPPSTTHALLLRDGTAVASGPVAETLHEDALTACLGLPVRMRRIEGRWSAHAAEPASTLPVLGRARG